MRLIGSISILAALTAALPAAGSTIAGGAGAHITVLAADEVQDLFVRAEEGRPVLRLPSGESWELIPDADDPEIANPGDGSFHPVDLQEAVAALDAIDPAFTAAVEATVYILPMPRRGLLDSSAGEGAIYLSPGVRPLAPAQIRSLVAHEFGHVVQRRVLPDTDEAGWSAYSRMRGISDASVYFAGAAHKNRPHEIFAEDFRYLFGGAGANSSASIENADLALPDDVQGLREWMAELVFSPVPPAVLAVSNFPDPFVAKTTIRWSAPADAGSPYSLRVFDAAGRLVKMLEEGTAGAGSRERTVVWDGRDGAGRIAAAGVYFAVLSAGPLTATEKLNVVR